MSTSPRIAYLERMIALHLATRDAEIARGVDAAWIDEAHAANVAELARSVRTPVAPAAVYVAAPVSPALAAQSAREEARMGRILRAHRGAL